MKLNSCKLHTCKPFSSYLDRRWDFGSTRGFPRSDELAFPLNHHYVRVQRYFSVEEAIFGISCLKAFQKMFTPSHQVCTLYKILSFLCNPFLVSINPRRNQEENPEFHVFSKNGQNFKNDKILIWFQCWCQLK